MKTFSKITVAMLTMSAVAVAQPKADKAPAPAPAKDAKPAAGAPPAKDAKAQVAPKEAMPTVPPELIEMAKVSTGTWKCKGESFERDGSKTAITATNKAKADLDKWWIAETLEVKGMKMGAFKMATYTTFDAASKKWRRIGLDNWGGQMVGTADAAPMGQPMVFNLDTLGPMGAGQFRDHTDPSDLKAGLKVWGEMSMDKGKTWVKVYEMVCKK
jgi:hypothetical protein